MNSFPVPFWKIYLVVRPGIGRGLKVPRRRYRELMRAKGDQSCPDWLVDSVRHGWPDLDLANRRLHLAVLVRSPSSYGSGRASYELNLGCNYACEHCYLGLKRFDGLPWPKPARLLEVLRDAGVLWLQLTGGEPLIDRLFGEVYRYAFESAMTP